MALLAMIAAQCLIWWALAWVAPKFFYGMSGPTLGIVTTIMATVYGYVDMRERAAQASDRR